VETSDLRLGLAALAALVGGGGIGWWLRGRYNWSRSVIMDELWTRKIRSFEELADQALGAQTLATSAQRSAEERLEQERRRCAELAELGQRFEHELEQRRGELARERGRVEELELLAADIEVRLRAEREARAQGRTKLETLEKRLRALRPYPGRLEECEAALARVEVRAAEQAEEKQAEIARLTDWIAELTPLSETLRRRGEELAALRESESQLRSAHARELAQQSALRSEHEALLQECTRSRAERERLAGEARDFERLRQESIQRGLKITELGVRLDQAEQALARERAQRDELNAGLEAAVLSPKGSARKRPSATPADDLTAIKGIGPKVAERLAAAGVVSYAQLAALAESDLDELSAEISIPRKRIEREGWIAAAAELR
jgi:predicted flap endonuclease-1-like 5' DNA nuclease